MIQNRLGRTDMCSTLTWFDPVIRLALTFRGANPSDQFCNSDESCTMHNSSSVTSCIDLFSPSFFKPKAQTYVAVVVGRHLSVIFFLQFSIQNWTSLMVKCCDTCAGACNPCRVITLGVCIPREDSIRGTLSAATSLNAPITNTANVNFCFSTVHFIQVPFFGFLSI